jgi:hypothetical protein
MEPSSVALQAVINISTDQQLTGKPGLNYAPGDGRSPAEWQCPTTEAVRSPVWPKKSYSPPPGEKGTQLCFAEGHP